MTGERMLKNSLSGRGGEIGSCPNAPKLGPKGLIPLTRPGVESSLGERSKKEGKRRVAAVSTGSSRGRLGGERAYGI